MFNERENYAAWRSWQKLYEAGNQKMAHELLAALMPQFRASQDDLRILFYIGQHADETAYRNALSFFSEWRTNPPARFAYRCSAYVYALEHSLSTHIRAEKPYLIPLFLETTGFDPATQTTTDDS